MNNRTIYSQLADFGSRISDRAANLGERLFVQILPITEAGACIGDAGKVCFCGQSCVRLCGGVTTAGQIVYSLDCFGNCNRGGCICPDCTVYGG